MCDMAKVNEQQALLKWCPEVRFSAYDRNAFAPPLNRYGEATGLTRLLRLGARPNMKMWVTAHDQMPDLIGLRNARQ